MIKRTVSDFKRQSARRLRSDSTNVEAVLWRHLRQLNLKGSHFSRQAVIGPYIADFACLAARLLIEVDGSQHGTDGGKRRDDARTRWLNAEGYRVLRFWNNDVMSEPKSAMEAIYRALDVTPPRRPSADDPPLKGRVDFLRSE
ncbi:MAG: endonuclease domain-containing protein [Nitrobacter sp.]